MKVTVLKNKQVKFEFEVKPDEFEHGIEHAYTKKQKEVEVKGFRKGHVPRNIYENNNRISFVYFNITLIILITTSIIDLNPNYVYIIPLCIIPLLFKAFFDSRIAFFIHSVTIMLLGFILITCS